MPVNVALGHVSNAFMIAALVIYSLSVVAFAGDFAYGRPRRAAAEARGQSQDRATALATVGAVGSTAAAPAAPGAAEASAVPGAPAVPGARAVPGLGRCPGSGGRAVSGPVSGADSMPELAVPPLRAIRQAGRWVMTAVALSAIGVAAQTTAVVTRGLAVHRAPWGNMYEFVTALTCVAAIFFLFVMIRYRAWALGVFVMGAVVVTLGLAETLIYTAAGELVPALQSYWLDIHVTAMTLATGIFFVARGARLVYLWRRPVRQAGSGRPGRAGQRDHPQAADHRATRPAHLPDHRVRLPGLDVRRHRGRDLGRPGLGPVLGLGPGGNLGLHHLGALRRVPARQGHRGLAWPAGPLHPAARLRQPDLQHPGRAGVHHRIALLRRSELTSRRG